MNLFRTDNTDGYTNDQLNILNNEWAIIAPDFDSPEYHQLAKQFRDEVAKR